MATVTGIGRADRPAHAEAELYERHSRGIFGYCLSRLGAREDAEDATQLTFLHAVRGLRRGVVPAAESAWLFGIARNVCLSRWASAGRRSRVETACDPSELERLTSAHDPRRDELIGLERALELLPEQQRRAVLLRDWRGLSYEEAAEQLGVSHAAVETLIFRGRAALAEHLSEQPREPRRRLGSLGSFWSLLDAVKGALSGAAAGAKASVAVGAAVAVSGGGIAIGTTLARDTDEPVRASEPSIAQPVAARTAGLPPGADAPARTSAAGPGKAGSPTSAAGLPGAAVIPAADRDTPAAPGAAVPAPQGDAKADPDAAARPASGLASSRAEESDAPLLDASLLPSTDPIVTATDPIVAATDPIVAATDPIVAAIDPIVAAIDPIVAATDPIVAATDLIVAATDPIVAATEPVMAEVDETLAAAPPLPPAPAPLLP